MDKNKQVLCHILFRVVDNYYTKIISLQYYNYKKQLIISKYKKN
jgi:hypothetical protein